jgi:hypothetical protein
MSDQPSTPGAEPRAPYSALRAWEPARDEAARRRARTRLQRHIDAGEAEPVTASPATRRPRRQRLRPPRRWLGPAIAAVVIAGAGGAVAAVLLRTEHTRRLPVFTPQGRLAPEFHVSARGRGYCWESSLASTEPDAYRCFQGNQIHDPCFAPSAHATAVVCFLDPWHSVTVLRLTRRLPKAGPPVKGPPLPWAIVTTAGRRCVFMTGATALVGGQRVNYGCTDGTYLIGYPDTRQALWTIRSDRRLSLSQMHTPLTRFPSVGIKQTVG